VEIKNKKGEITTVSKDEEFSKVDYSKIGKLKPAFSDKAGSVTAANSSKLSDGASAVLLMSQEKASSLGLKPLARIIGYADAARDPLDFTIAPALAVPLALERAKISTADVDFWEFNEAFSVVALANTKLLGLNNSNINVLGGAVALGHPIGSSGCRIVVTLAHLLHNRKKRYGVAAVCNGGGAASALVLERID